MPSEKTRDVVHDYYLRADFWQFRVPGNKRWDFWEWDNPGQYYEYYASDIVKFTKAKCIAKRTREFRDVNNEFKAELQRDWEASRLSPYNGTQLAQLLSRYVVWLDALFFFGVMTRPKRIGTQLTASKMLFNLHFGQTRDDALGIISSFRFMQSQVNIGLLKSGGDRSPRNYLKEYHQNEGHGVQFKELFHFILTKLLKWQPGMSYIDMQARQLKQELRAGTEEPPYYEASARHIIERSPIHFLL
ncbi:uncharacterized protein GGS25DRAFT_526625 [Hypoxylon fragiforme]|uniref:uncharacterized protein n=1 Tax=Hypoxylon fragiforme TaxID=63214 RepID=UPI0020C62AF1|nr:uncharacterized protein GGS25DRAFT_526625 [Hypoxylon fragiforme]KAI2603581.1 hypothetical protein GGS25DRAFT_526625 [Hypoxylon fragiforme]